MGIFLRRVPVLTVTVSKVWDVLPICITGWGCPATLSPAPAPGAVVSASPFLCLQNPSESKAALPSVCLRAHVFDSLPTRHGLDLVPVGGLQPPECPCLCWGCGVREAGNGKPSDIPWDAPSLSRWGNDQHDVKEGKGNYGARANHCARNLRESL